jgi:hypothetical protein
LNLRKRKGKKTEENYIMLKCVIYNSSPNIIRVIKSRRVLKVEQVISVMDEKCVQNQLGNVK